MAEHAYTRRRVPEGSPAPETPPPRRDASPARPLGAAGAFEIIDLNTHPDGKLLRLVVQATKLFDGLALGPAGPRSYSERGTDAVELMALYDEIAAISAVTADGWHTKATFASFYDGLGMTRGTVHAVAYSALRDALRLGMVS